MKKDNGKCKCPIAGCGYEFAYGILGWDSHVARVDNHPDYHPSIVIAENRKRRFQKDFPEFFDLSKRAEKRAATSGVRAAVRPGAYSHTKTGTK